eukprot:TRINITY_DN828_c2_g1_i1.p1 TRINITY_DN828_c2_g1~~TRINITY_DN828_c2_g1_i1.p1  ORF type:complete len:136 (-),score=34.57 TRINITY_DN828_c2_g1_i1:170-577(-)
MGRNTIKAFYGNPLSGTAVAIKQDMTREDRIRAGFLEEEKKRTQQAQPQTQVQPTQTQREKRKAGPSNRSAKKTKESTPEREFNPLSLTVPTHNEKKNKRKADLSTTNETMEAKNNNTIPRKIVVPKRPFNPIRE